MAATNRVMRFAPRAQPRARILAFPFAGGSAAAFRPWARRCPSDVELCAVEYAGHGARGQEPPLRSIDAIVADTEPAVNAILDRPFAVVGYSLGALVAYEWLRSLAARQGTAPVAFYVCASSAPSVAPPEPLLRTLDEPAFVERVQARYGGIPDAILQEPELLRALVPMLRADMTAYESYPRRERTPLNVAIHAFGGKKDRVVTRDELGAWKEATLGGFTLELFDAGHHFLATHGAPLEAAVLGTLGNGQASG